MRNLSWLLPALFVAGVASAQDLENRTSHVDEVQDDALQTDFLFESQWHELNNLDFRPLDEDSDQAIFDSDDRHGFAFTGVAATLGYQVDDRTRYVVGMSHRGLWGNDQMGGTNTFGGWAYFTAAYADYRMGDGDKATSVRVGRQFFDLGGLGGGRDYILSDILDMVRVDVKLGNAGTLVLVPMNVMGLTSATDDAVLYRYIGQSSPSTFGFRGDHMTRRMGGVLRLDGLSDALDASAYGFYTDIGALGTGSDISYHGLLGNFSDNDWVANAGARASYAAGAVTPFVAVDLSTGIDRKELIARDVDTSGFAVYAGASLDTRDNAGKGIKGRASFFQAQGGAYAQDGMQYSHGYTGMNGKYVGGVLTGRYLGIRPTAYVGMFGISDSPHDINRKGGAQVIEVQGSYDTSTVEIGAAFYMLADTGITYVDMAEVDTITPPYGYSREAFRAEGRLGKSLGQEVDLTLDAKVYEHISVGLQGAVFLPGAFYAQEVSRIAGDALGGEAMAWAVNGGTTVRF
ncbi:MAG: hypothetical protein JXX28_12995 [Deltaproteobacteria bacterium]|nr:hypothetical protein [Deltaproteobacteria bacterium]